LLDIKIDLFSFEYLIALSKRLEKTVCNFFSSPITIVGFARDKLIFNFFFFKTISKLLMIVLKRSFISN